MKKLFLLFAAACVLFACDPVSEEISNGGHITVEELLAKTTVSLDKAPDGSNGNVVTCETHAPVNANWTIAGKTFQSSYTTKKLKLGDQVITLEGLCADGTLLEASFPVSVQTITDPLQKFYIYGEDPETQPSFTPPGWDSNFMRFSDNEGKVFPFLSDDIYWGFKTLVFDVAEASADCKVRVMSGWWDALYKDGNDVFDVAQGLWELTLTEDIAKVCAKGNGGQSHDLTLMVTSGSCTINSVYYEE